jgi:uncharacterized protein (TIGR03435 family)
LTKLADVLADSLDCPVVDMTALEGVFESDVNWSPDENPSVSAPSISAAVQEELGLKLEPRKYPARLPGN